MGSQIAIQRTFEMVECANCCIAFAVPGRFIRDRRDDHGTFYCPRGHHNHFAAASEAEKLRIRLADEERRRVNTETAAQQLRESQNQVAKRIANGVCPCCNRTFANLQRHMHTKHSQVKMIAAGKTA